MEKYHFTAETKHKSIVGNQPDYRFEGIFKKMEGFMDESRKDFT
ncbi:MAG: hypothetical protein JWM44_4523 [Bacilli bacterium]|jgi:hypothetical protein|nr:hypothetical protein [Bacilli bacterium]